MRGRCGVILLDGPEIIYQIFEDNGESGWQQIYALAYDLTTFEAGPVQLDDVVALFTKMVIQGTRFEVKEWRFAARYVPDSLVEELSQGMRVKIKQLTLKREQDLICQALSGGQIG